MKALLIHIFSGNIGHCIQMYTCSTWHTEGQSAYDYLIAPYAASDYGYCEYICIWCCIGHLDRPTNSNFQLISLML